MKNYQNGISYIWKKKEITDIIHLYVTMNYTMQQIANKYNVSVSTISRLLIKNKIPTKHTEKQKRRFNWTSSQKEAMVNYYENGCTLNKIAQKYNTTKSTIKRILNANNISLRQHVIIWAPKDVKDIISKYKNGMTMPEISQEFNVSYSAIRNLLQKNNVDIRDSSDYDQKKYSLDIDYFSKIDSRDKAYWLGFIMADGSVNHNRLKIALNTIDERHLEKFATCVKTDCPIKSYGYNIVEINVYSKDFVANLYKHGVIPNKVKCAQMPPIAKNFISHFWRGMIDGDGSIFCTKKGKLNLTLYGNKFIVSAFERYIKSLCSTKANTICSKCGTYSFRVTGSFAKKCLKEIYNDTHDLIFLDRKCNRYLKFCSE